jgi:hypothetical protein
MVGNDIAVSTTLSTDVYHEKEDTLANLYLLTDKKVSSTPSPTTSAPSFNPPLLPDITLNVTKYQRGMVRQNDDPTDPRSAIFLECETSVVPNKITWRKNGQLLKEMDKEELTSLGIYEWWNSGKLSTLYIRRAANTEKDEYRCVAILKPNENNRRYNAIDSRPIFVRPPQ